MCNDLCRSQREVYHISLWQNEIKHAQQLVDICPGLLFALMPQELGDRHPCIQPRQPYALLTTGIQHSRLQLWILHGWDEIRLQCILMPYSCVHRDQQPTHHIRYKARAPTGCTSIALGLLVAPAEVSIGVRAGQAAVGLNRFGNILLAA